MSLRFGLLPRIWCPNCLEETIHKNGTCVRSGCGHTVKWEPNPAYDTSKYREGREFKKKIAQYIVEHPLTSYAKIGTLFKISTATVGKIASIHNISRIKSRWAGL